MLIFRWLYLQGQLSHQWSKKVKRNKSHYKNIVQLLYQLSTNSGQERYLNLFSRKKKIYQRFPKYKFFFTQYNLFIFTCDILVTVLFGRLSIHHTEPTHTTNDFNLDSVSPENQFSFSSCLQNSFCFLFYISYLQSRPRFTTNGNW